MTPAAAFGTVLREARNEQGISQDRLALLSGHNRAYVGLLERGENTPTLDTVFRLAGALGLAPSTLLARAEGLVDHIPPNTPGRGRWKSATSDTPLGTAQ
jgi:transcriptional regulator with XRE-family HTH domain